MIEDIIVNKEKKDKLVILSIETSCDETGISIVEYDGKGSTFAILSNKLYSQAALHAPFGGVYPLLAKREHEKNLPFLLKEALEETGLNKEKPEIDYIAVTVGPGLEIALWTGLDFAKSLSITWDTPLLPINHMDGHIEIAKLESLNTNKKEFKIKDLEHPSIAFLISGGHTELILIEKDKKTIIGSTKDDALGEAYDKVARLLGLGYPGGPEIEKRANIFKLSGNNLDTFVSKYKFPRPMLHSKDYNFSFSGVKTHALYMINDLKRNNNLEKLPEEMINEICFEFEKAVVETIIKKVEKAILEYSPKNLILGGGVVANKNIRLAFENLNKKYPETTLLVPEISHSTDNALMIAVASLEYLKNGRKIYKKEDFLRENSDENSEKLVVNGNLKVF